MEALESWFTSCLGILHGYLSFVLLLQVLPGRSNGSMMAFTGLPDRKTTSGTTLSTVSLNGIQVSFEKIYESAVLSRRTQYTWR